MKHEFKKMRFKMDDYNEEEGIFSGYGAVFENIDSGGDIIEPGAFTKTLAEGWERVKVLALHNDCWLPIGRPIELREEPNGLFISGKISDTTMGRDVKVLLKDRVLNELSIGYDPIIFDYDENGIRHLREIKLWEVSVVTWAMNSEAVITSYKSMEERAEQALAIKQNLLQELKEGRKISNSRLKSLKDVSKSMKDSARTIDAVIREASNESGQKARGLAPTYSKSNQKQIEIIF